MDTRNRKVPSLDERRQHGATLKTLRTLAGLSQTQFGERAGLQPQNISHWETGLRDVGMVRLPSAAGMARALGLTLDEFARLLLTVAPWPVDDQLPQGTVRERRISLHLSNPTVANMMGVSRQAITRWEKEGCGNMELRHAVALARILHVTVEQLAAM